MKTKLFDVRKVVSLVSLLAPLILFGTPTTWWVATNGVDEEGRGGEDEPFATLPYALGKAVDGDTIKVAEGDFELSAELAVNKAVTLVGKGKGITTLFRKPSVAKMRILNISAAAIVRDFTIRGGLLSDAKGDLGAGVLMTAGTLSDCEVCFCTNLLPKTNGNGYGGAVCAREALVDGCVIHDNFATGCDGAAVYLGANATLSNSLVRGNRNDMLKGYYTCGGVVALGTATSVMDKCTVTENFAMRYGAVYAKNGSVRDSVIWGNDGWEKGFSFFDVAGEAAKFSNCHYESNPDFVDAAAQDYRLAASSPVAATLGAFGKVEPISDYGLRANKLKVVEGGEVAFTSCCFGVSPAECVWDFGDGSTEVDTGTGAVHAYAKHGTYTVKLLVDGEVVATRANYISVTPSTVFVDEVSANPTPPYASAETAARHVEDVDAYVSEGATVQVAAGDYALTTGLRLLDNVTFQGSGWTNCILRQTAGTRVVTLNAASKLDGFTVCDGVLSVSFAEGCGVSAVEDGAVISHCCISNNVFGSTNMKGGGVRMDDSTISHCIICCNGQPVGSAVTVVGPGGGVAVMQQNLKQSTAEIDNCLFYGNGGDDGGGLYLKAACKVTNCTFANNRSTKSGGGVFVATATYYSPAKSAFVNCIFSDNVAASDTGDGRPNWSCAKSADLDVDSKNCLFGNDSATFGISPETGAVEFKSLVNNDFHLGASSAAKTSGFVLPDMPVDLDGVERSDESCAIGCYEYVASAEFTCSMAVSPLAAFTDEEVMFAASAENVPGDGVPVFTWTLTDTFGNQRVLEGASVVAPFPHVGIHKVSLAATAGGQTVRKSYEYDLQIAARTNYVTAAVSDAAEFPYDAPEKAATNVLDVLDWLIDRSVVVLDAGDHFLTNEAVVASAVTLSGAGMDATRIIRVGKGRCFTVNNRAAVLQDLTIAGGRYDRVFSKGANVNFGADGGILRRCRLTAGRIDDQNNHICGAAFASDSIYTLVENCIINANTNTQCRWANSASGMIIHLAGGKMRNCLIADNQAEGNNAIHVGAEAEVENCTVVSNVLTHAITQVIPGEGGTSIQPVVVLYSKGGKIRNCVFSHNATPNNTAPDGELMGKPNWALANASYAAYVQMNCWDGSTDLGTGCVAQNPCFVSPDSGNWRLCVPSSCRNAGQKLDWMEGAADLDGRPRVFGRRPDLGCYELQQGYGLTVLIR